MNRHSQQEQATGNTDFTLVRLRKEAADAAAHII